MGVGESGGSAAVFVYGTLRFGAVLLRVAGTSFPAESASLRGYSRHRFRESTFPGIVPAPGGSVSGTLYRDVSPELLERIDAFEGEPFERLRVRVVVGGGGTDAWTYVVREAFVDRLAAEDWVEGDFVAFHLQDFLSRL